MRDTKSGGTSIPIGKERKVVAQVVTVVTTLILLRFSCHHFNREVMTKLQMVTDKEGFRAIGPETSRMNAAAMGFRPTHKAGKAPLRMPLAFLLQVFADLCSPRQGGFSIAPLAR
jgi:hypothetical protein